jgi:hypothetical protein
LGCRCCALCARFILNRLQSWKEYLIHSVAPLHDDPSLMSSGGFDKRRVFLRPFRTPESAAPVIPVPGASHASAIFEQPGPRPLERRLLQVARPQVDHHFIFDG